jgi:hypothetical protein
MIIRSITICDFADIGYLKATFDSQVIQLTMPEADTVMKAIAVILKSVVVKDFISRIRIRSGTSISAEICVNGEVLYVCARGSPSSGGFDYSVRDGAGRPVSGFYEAIHVNEEEDLLSWFGFDPDALYSQRLRQYKQADRYYQEETFSRMTEGTGCTRTFRALLNRYIKDFESLPLPGKQNCCITIKGDGTFVTEKSEDSVLPVPLTENERISFEFQCFLAVNDFWRRVEAVRNMNHIKRPLVVCGADVVL